MDSMKFQCPQLNSPRSTVSQMIQGVSSQLSNHAQKNMCPALNVNKIAPEKNIGDFEFLVDQVKNRCNFLVKKVNNIKNYCAEKNVAVTAQMFNDMITSSNSISLADQEVIANMIIKDCSNKLQVDMDNNINNMNNELATRMNNDNVNIFNGEIVEPDTVEQFVTNKPNEKKKPKTKCKTQKNKKKSIVQRKKNKLKRKTQLIKPTTIPITLFSSTYPPTTSDYIKLNNYLPVMLRNDIESSNTTIDSHKYNNKRLKPYYNNNNTTPHIGSYLLPTLATLLKKKQKLKPPNILEELPFITGQSINKSHNLATRLQDNKLHLKKKQLITQTDPISNNLNKNIVNLINFKNVQKSVTRHLDSVSNTNNNNENTLIIDNSYDNKKEMVIANDFSKSLNIDSSENFQKLDLRTNHKIKSVLTTLYKTYSNDISRHEQLKIIIKANQNNCEIIQEFKSLCEKLEDDENLIQVLLYLINSVLMLDKNLEGVSEHQTVLHGSGKLRTNRRKSV